MELNLQEIGLTPQQLHKLAEQLIQQGQYGEAADYLRYGRYDGQALYMLAEIYDHLSIEQINQLNLPSQDELVLMAAYASYPPAMKQAGDIYWNGSKLYPQDQSLAFSWYLRAYQLQETSARPRLIVCYQNGIGTKQDFKKVVELKKEAEKEQN